METKHMAAVTISPYKTCYSGGWPKSISRFEGLVRTTSKIFRTPYKSTMSPIVECEGGLSSQRPFVAIAINWVAVIYFIRARVWKNVVWHDYYPNIHRRKNQMARRAQSGSSRSQTTSRNVPMYDLLHVQTRMGRLRRTLSNICSRAKMNDRTGIQREIIVPAIAHELDEGLPSRT
jgi:hypothetical protein